MKTNDIVRALRNSTTPAARLAAWQNLPLPYRAKRIREAKYHGDTSAKRRAKLIHSTGPELSAPEADKPILWSGVNGAEIADSFPGRDFLSHRGWYTDGHCDDTYEAYAVTLKRFPGLVFEAIRDSCGGDLRVYLADSWEVDFSDLREYPENAIADTAKQAVRSCDSTAERQAEEAREYYEKDQKEQDLAQAREDLQGTRDSIRELVWELKRLCPLPVVADFPVAASAVRAALKSLLRERKETIGTIRNLERELA